MKENSKAHATTGNFVQRAPHGNQCILFTSLLLSRHQAILVLLAIAEFQAVHRLEIGADLFAAFGVQEDVETRTRADTHVMLALGADVEGLFQLRAIQNGFAGRALVPQTFRHRALAGLGAHDGRDQLVYQPVAHACCSPELQFGML